MASSDPICPTEPVIKILFIYALLLVLDERTIIPIGSKMSIVTLCSMIFKTAICNIRPDVA